MQKKINRVKAIFVILLLSFFLSINTGMAQEPVTKKTPATELKRLWKKNELLIGIGSAMLFTLIVYALWRKKKSSSSNIDSMM